MGILRSLAPQDRRAAAFGGIPPGDPALAALWGFSNVASAGVYVSPETSRRCPEVDACVCLIEDTIATLPLDLFERVTEDERERRDDHPLHALLHDQPNDYQSSAEFRQMLEGWRSTYGNAYAKIVWGGGAPRELKPMHPLEVFPFRTQKGEVAYYYTPAYGGSPETLLQHEVLHLRDHPFERDLIRGQSRVVRHQEVIGRCIATGEYMSRFFSNGAVPKTFLVPPQGSVLTDEQVKLLRDQFEQRHAGLDNVHRIGVLNGGFDVKAIAVDNEKAQVVESYKLAVAQVARIWGVPLHLIAESSGATSWGTGIEQQSIGFVVYFVRPKLVVWEQALNMALMSSEMRRQFYFEFNVDGLLRGDFKSRMDGFALMIQWGLATPNEVRKMMNLPPLEGGDDRLAPLNMVPATRIMDVLMKSKDGNQKDAADQATRVLAHMISQSLSGLKSAA